MAKAKHTNEAEPKAPVRRAVAAAARATQARAERAIAVRPPERRYSFRTLAVVGMLGFALGRLLSR